ncbi:hypothetical protein V3G39_07930 [Dermatophilaceae bacterium Sec6.4]
MAVTDLLADVQWTCSFSATADSADTPPGGQWWPMAVPGTAAQAMVDAGDPSALTRNYDDVDWWFRCHFTGPGETQKFTLRLGGLATLADVWLDGEHLLHSENMFVANELDLDLEPGPCELVVRCAALTPALAPRRPRPRWKCADLVHPNLRWIRTSLIGRLTGGVPTPAPVGPWRPVTLTPVPEVSVARRRLVAEPLDDGSGRIQIEVEVTGSLGQEVWVEADGFRAVLHTMDSGEKVLATGVLELPSVRRWWPHTHGDQPLYEVIVEVGAVRTCVGRVGFRTIDVDRSAGAFTVRCNGVPVFCRGACWTPLDPVSLAPSAQLLRDRLDQVRRGHLNMIRVTAVGTYESDEFYNVCDELGILVWQDCMFAFFDAPVDQQFQTQVAEEVTQLFGRLQARPSVAVICGGSENEQQAAYLGLPPERWAALIAQQLIPAMVRDLLPGVEYVRSTPGESPLPSMVDRGPGHYFGVGAYLKPIEDARRARVRFASECLAFANPPEPLDTLQGQSIARGIGHRPEWKSGIHRDASTAWDLEDIRDWYTQKLFDVDTIEVRRVDGEAAAQIARATVAMIYEGVLAEWRRADSPCSGALVLEMHDARFAGGLGLVDALGRPKSSWYVMRRVMSPAVVVFSDEGVNGLLLHVASDRRDTWQARIRLDLLIDGERVGDSVSLEASVSKGGAEIETATVFGGFRDLSYAHRFGPPAYDVIVATLYDTDDRELSRAVWLPGQRLRPVERDLGLRAVLTPGVDPAEPWRATLTTRRFAQWVNFDLADWVPSDSWFHLVPGASVFVGLRPLGAADNMPSGSVRAMNCPVGCRLEQDGAT